MSSSTKKGYYWQDIGDLASDSSGHWNEFESAIPSAGAWDGTTRRDFLKWMGFSVAAASLAACEAPVRKAIPYLNKPVDVNPGVPNYYASTYAEAGSYGSLLVKTREGRPIKVEPNPDGNLMSAGTSPQIEASVLDLYDETRLRGPLKFGQKTEWQQMDSAIKFQLKTLSQAEKRIVLVSHTLLSPSAKKAIEIFKRRYPSVVHVAYDSLSYAGALDANEADFGWRAMPTYDFEKTDCVVSVGADFLGTWLNPHLFSRQFARRRQLKGKQKTMTRLYVFESNLSLTGTQADYRYPVRASEYLNYLSQLYNEIARTQSLPLVKVRMPLHSAHIEQVAGALLKAKGRSMVLCGANDKQTQRLCNAINVLLGNYRKNGPLSWARPCYLKQGDDSAMRDLIRDLQADHHVDGLIFYNCNPVYDYPDGAVIKQALSKISLSVSTSGRLDETARASHYVAPDHHYLESWNDAEPAYGLYSFTQPTIRPLFKTRQTPESLLVWAAHAQSNYFAFLKKQWQARHQASGRVDSFTSFWDRCLYTGVYVSDPLQSLPKYRRAALGGALVAGITLPAPTVGLELVLYESPIIGSGAQANNPWLQELPDPISKVSWENVLALSQHDADRIGLSMKGDETRYVHVQMGNKRMSLPAVIQPGQKPGTLGLALGYGRSAAGPVGNGIGYHAYPHVRVSKEGYRRLSGIPISALSLGNPYTLARMQTHSTAMHRQTIIQEATLSAYQKDPYAGRYRVKISTSKGKVAPHRLSLWDGHRYPNHHWGMVIDLNSCTGCSACVVACQAENNIPVVGKEEVTRKRDMHWLRIDRYYKSKGKAGDMSRAGLSEAESPVENPEVVFQPMLCQHCNHAPCETVCPVAATTHSSEGLNQMTYNRCVGTRYCANNCPYKVRRFNWFKYHDNDAFAHNKAMNNALGKMVLNPDVTVRARGVMEKCTFCVQRIQAGKLKAKQGHRKVQDRDVQPACASACPTDAIRFGDLKDPKSAVSQALALKTTEKGEVSVEEPRAYHVLEELNVQPNVWYLTKIRNKA